MITKELLQLFCKSLGLESSGTKEALKARICDKLCGDKKEIKSLRSLLGKKKNNKKVYKILKDIKEMLDDDSEIESIVRTIKKFHGVKARPSDIEDFSQLVDAHEKGDLAFIDEYDEEPCYGRVMLNIYINPIANK
jgi:hypothetical protein